MKGYEKVTSTKMIPRMPVIIRVDGKAFHTLTKRWQCERPYDHRLHFAMVYAMRATAAAMQSCVFGYTQSDEVSFLLKDWNTFESQQWFGGKLQKLASVAASTVARRVFC